jgi:hypothetical protein
MCDFIKKNCTEHLWCHLKKNYLCWMLNQRCALLVGQDIRRNVLWLFGASWLCVCVCMNGCVCVCALVGCVYCMCVSMKGRVYVCLSVWMNGRSYVCVCMDGVYSIMWLHVRKSVCTYVEFPRSGFWTDYCICTPTLAQTCACMTAITCSRQNAVHKNPSCNRLWM